MNRWPIALAIIALLVLAGKCGPASAESPGIVLVINSYHGGYPWSDNEMNGIFETFRNASGTWELRTEHLDAKFYPRLELFPLQKWVMAEKYRGKKIPVVIATDNPALEFALTYRDEMFPEAAIVFCGVNGFTPEMIAGQRNVTGVAERLDTARTLETALELHPDTTDIFVVHDYTTTGLATRREAEADLARFAPRVKIRFMENLSTAAMLKEVKSLKRGTLILALSYSLDRDGIVYDHPRIARLLAENSRVPVYGAHEERIGHGIIGGSLLGGRMQGQKAAELALRILDGEKPERIPVVRESPVRLMFDYRQMKRFSVPIAGMPGGAVILNEPESFYRKYKGLVWSTIGVLTGLVLIICLLILYGTQKRRAEQAIARKAHELEQTNRELEEFNVLAYHDLQEPLRSIGSFAQLLERKYAGVLDAEGKEYLGFIVDGVHRLKQLFNDFLSYTRQTRSEDDIDLVDLNQTLGEVRNELGSAIADTSARIDADPLPVVVGSRVQLKLLFRHLLDNAIKFRGDSLPRIRITASPVEHDVRISVIDNGIGIEPQYHDRIFKIFERLHHQDHSPGTGIGLALCRKIVTLHGGRIWVESVPGRETAVHFSLERGSIGNHDRQGGKE
jgi:signal transduction histidine kinase